MVINAREIFQASDAPWKTTIQNSGSSLSFHILGLVKFVVKGDLQILLHNQRKHHKVGVKKKSGQRI